MKEIIDTVLKCSYSKCRLKYNDVTLLFTYNKQQNYWIQRIENKYYGLSITDDGTVIYGYPHLWNIKDDTEFSLQSCILELKMNGTCIPISMYNGKVNIRTRMNAFPEEFTIPTFWNETINAIRDESLRSKILSLRTEMIQKYPEWYVYEADGEYVGLKIQKVVRDILNVDYITSYNDNYVYYFELFGKVNPILVDSDFKYGNYDIDYNMVLFDIFDKETQTFVDRDTKEEIASELGLTVVPVVFNFSNSEDLLKAIPFLKSEADKGLIEGYVLKNGIDIIKVKSDVVLNSAMRLDAILKGYIDLRDMYNYISKVVTVEYLKMPDKFDELVELIQEEAKADYPDNIVSKQYKQIQKRIAHQMAIFAADEIIKEKVFTEPGDLFRYLNLEIPKRFAPLKSYIDFEAEKQIEDKHIREKVKRIRTNLFDVVARYCMKKLQISRGKY